ncbi:MAG TPA: hypothetical protein VKQ36_11785, partial [Ktedonobacterales bacterium]|nr:hypothetical protein [Ktedonobacterales bacterium]
MNSDDFTNATTLRIGAETYAFRPHPTLTPSLGEVYALVGGEATIYQLRQVGSGALFALKIPRPVYCTARAVTVTQALARLIAIPGFAAARRRCLTRASDPLLIAQWSALEYATLAPWIAGRSWADLLLDRAASETYTREQALTLART